MDLSLLLALDALLTEGSVARAAERMNLSAPAMSRTLTRIRDAVGDPILVRAGRRMVPTPRAEAMRARVRALVTEAQDLLRPDALDRATLARCFTIRMGFSGALAAPLLAALRREAPGTSLRFVAEGEEQPDELRDGRIDLDIGVIGPAGPELRVQTLYREGYVGVVRAGHPLLDGMSGGAKDGDATPSPARFAACAHISASRRGRARGPIDAGLDALGLARRVELVVPGSDDALFAAAQSDLVAAVPDSAARRAIALGLPLVRFPLPVPVPPVVVAQAWHPRQHGDPAHRFLRETVLSVSYALTTAPPPTGG